MTLELDEARCPICDSPVIDYAPGVSAIKVDGVLYHPSCYDNEVYPGMSEAEGYHELMKRPNTVFVFGANTRGVHGAGAAKAARKYGAQNGIGNGLRGRSYAIPTKDYNLRTLPLAKVAKYVKQFLTFAEQSPGTTFVLTRIGCVLAGYDDQFIAPLFREATPNVIIPDKWKPLMNPEGSRAAQETANNTGRPQNLVSAGMQGGTRMLEDNELAHWPDYAVLARFVPEKEVSNGLAV